jgi:hypothetical protein
MEHNFEGVGEPRSKEIVEGGLERNIPGWVSTQEGRNKISTHTHRLLPSGRFRSGFQPRKQQFMDVF